MLWTLAVVAIATSNGSMVAFAVAFVLVALTTTGLQFVWAIRTQPLRFAGARRRWRQLLRGGIPLGIAGLLTLAYVRIDGVLVFHIAGADQAGLYGAVYRTLDRVQMVPTAVMTTVFPLLAAAWPVDPERVRRLLQAAADHLLMFALPALALAIAAPEPIVRLLFGGEFEDAAPALPVLMGAFVAISLWHLAMNMVIVLGLQRRLMVYAALALIVNVALNLIFIPKHGFMAAAWITLATETLVMALAVRTVLQETGFRPAPRQMSLVTLCACAAGLLAWRLEAAGLPILLVAALMLVGYGAALLAVRALDLRELVGLVRPPRG